MGDKSKIILAAIIILLSSIVLSGGFYDIKKTKRLAYRINKITGTVYVCKSNGECRLSKLVTK